MKSYARFGISTFPRPHEEDSAGVWNEAEVKQRAQGAASLGRRGESNSYVEQPSCPSHSVCRTERRVSCHDGGCKRLARHEYPPVPRYSAQNVDDKDINMKTWLSAGFGSILEFQSPSASWVELQTRQVVNTPPVRCFLVSLVGGIRLIPTRPERCNDTLKCIIISQT